MAYVLEAGESVPAGIMRVIQEQLEDAAAQLSQTDKSKRDDAIHEARKSVKKIRAALRLVEDDLGALFDRENIRLRNTGRKLASFRDAAAAIEIFEGVLADAKLEKDTLGSIRRGLVQEKRKSDQSPALRTVLGKLAKSLSTTDKRVKQWPLRTGGYPGIEKGLKRTFRRGRKAMAAAYDTPTPENYHDWRKRVKDHWYHLTLLEHLWTPEMEKQEKILKELETCLGNDHDLVLLLEKLQAPGAKYRKQDIDSFVELAGDHQKKLRESAASLGEEIYDEKPGTFVKRVGKRWSVWQKHKAK
jgi:CHAD domain-containing protein